MPIYQFKCDKCKKEFDESFFLDGKDPPEFTKCANKKCKNKKALRQYWTEGQEINGWGKGYTDRNRRREKKILIDGMDKSAAEEFYKQSIEASKERMKSGGEHYKKVDPDMKYFREKGLVKVNNDKRRAEKAQNLKIINTELARRAKIDPFKK